MIETRIKEQGEHETTYMTLRAETKEELCGINTQPQEILTDSRSKKCK